MSTLLANNRSAHSQIQPRSLYLREPDVPRFDNLVVTYHYVREQNSDGVTGITPKEFDQQIRAIKANYRVVTVDEFVFRSGIERGLALITFDDAVRDQYAAAEILARHQAPAVFFAPMRPYSDETDRWCTQHLLHALAQHLGWTELERRLSGQLDGVEIDVECMNRLYHYEAPHKRRLKYALAFCFSAEEARTLLGEINASIGLRADDWYMTAAQLRELQSTGHSLGGHGFDHVPYDTLSAEGQLADMQRAVQTMNTLFEERPRSLAYPFGRSTMETEGIARQCGYTHVFTTGNRIDAKYVLDEIAGQKGEGRREP